MRFSTSEFITSITGISTITGASLLAIRKYDLAALVFTFLTVGSLGVIWERYSRKAGSPLDLKVLTKKALPEKDEIDFILIHSPYPFLAAAAYILAKRRLK
jgi:hypothetical protein